MTIGESIIGDIASHYARRREFAVHEAGHAVHAVKHDIPLQYTTIDLNQIPEVLRGGNGYTRVNIKLNGQSSEISDIFLAGIAAQFVAGTPNDINEIANECRNDVQRAQANATWQNPRHPAMELICSFRDALRFAQDNITSILAVADALLARNTLTGADVADIIAANPPRIG